MKDLLQDKKVIEWLEILNAPESTVKAYLQAMRDFTDVTNKTPSDLILEARDEVQNGIPKGEQKLKSYFIKFRKYLQDKQIADMTIVIGLLELSLFTNYSILISLYSHNMAEKPDPSLRRRIRKSLQRRISGMC